MRWNGKDGLFGNSKDSMKLHVRGLYSSLQGIAMALGLYYLPPPTVHTINASGPVLVYIVDYFRNGTHVVRKQIFGIMLGFIGIMMTINSDVLCEWVDL